MTNILTTGSARLNDAAQLSDDYTGTFTLSDLTLENITATSVRYSFTTDTNYGAVAAILDPNEDFPTAAQIIAGKNAADEFAFHSSYVEIEQSGKQASITVSGLEQGTHYCLWLTHTGITFSQGPTLGELGPDVFVVSATGVVGEGRSFLLNHYFGIWPAGYNPTEQEIIDGTGSYGRDIQLNTPSGVQVERDWGGLKANVPVDLVWLIRHQWGDEVISTLPNIVNPNSPAEGVLILTGDPLVGSTLTLDANDISDPDGLGPFTYEFYTGVALLQSGATNTYVVQPTDVGSTIYGKVKFTDEADTQEEVTSNSIGPITAVNSPVQGVPYITGTVEVGEELTANVENITDANGLGPFTYHWTRDGNDISGATGNKYTIQQSDVGYQISVYVSFTDGDGFFEVTGSATPTAAVPGPNSPGQGKPVINGIAMVGETLTTDVSGITDADGIDQGSWVYQWQYFFSNQWYDSEATIPDITLEEDAIGFPLRVGVKYTDNNGNEEGWFYSDATDAVVNKNHVATGQPTITGDAIVGQTLQANLGSIADGNGLPLTSSFSWQWKKDNVNHATGTTYEIVAGDVGSSFTVEASFTDVDGYAEGPLESDPTATVVEDNTPATGVPHLFGAAVVGGTLTCSAGSLVDPDGFDEANFDYRWFSESDELFGQTASTYVPTLSDLGKYITCAVGFDDDKGNREEWFLSNQVGPVIEDLAEYFHDFTAIGEGTLHFTRASSTTGVDYQQALMELPANTASRTGWEYNNGTWIDHGVGYGLQNDTPRTNLLPNPRTSLTSGLDGDGLGYFGNGLAAIIPNLPTSWLGNNPSNITPTDNITGDKVPKFVGTWHNAVADADTPLACISEYVKPDGMNWMQIVTGEGYLGQDRYCNVDLLNRTVGTNTFDTDTFYFIDVQELGDGWLRVIYLAVYEDTSVTKATTGWCPYLNEPQSKFENVAGDNVSGILYAGQQVEVTEQTLEKGFTGVTTFTDDRREPGLLSMNPINLPGLPSSGLNDDFALQIVFRIPNTTWSLIDNQQPLLRFSGDSEDETQFNSIRLMKTWWGDLRATIYVDNDVATYACDFTIDTGFTRGDVFDLRVIKRSFDDTTDESWTVMLSVNGGAFDVKTSGTSAANLFRTNLYQIGNYFLGADTPRPPQIELVWLRINPFQLTNSQVMAWDQWVEPLPIITAEPEDILFGDNPVTEPATIISHPTSQAVTEPTGAVFNATASGTLPITYQWEAYNGSSWVPVQDYIGSASGYDTPTLSINPTDHSFTGTPIRLAVSNVGGFDSSNTATLTVNEADGSSPIIFATDFSGADVDVWETKSVNRPDINSPPAGWDKYLITSRDNDDGSKIEMMQVISGVGYQGSAALEYKYYRQPGDKESNNAQPTLALCKHLTRATHMGYPELYIRYHIGHSAGFQMGKTQGTNGYWKHLRVHQNTDWEKLQAGTVAPYVSEQRPDSFYCVHNLRETLSLGVTKYTSAGISLGYWEGPELNKGSSRGQRHKITYWRGTSAVQYGGAHTPTQGPESSQGMFNHYGSPAEGTPGDFPYVDGHRIPDDQGIVYHTVELRLKPGTKGNFDAIVQLWFDGVEQSVGAHIRYTETDSNNAYLPGMVPDDISIGKADHISPQGNGYNYVTLMDNIQMLNQNAVEPNWDDGTSRMFISDFVVSRERIGHSDVYIPVGITDNAGVGAVSITSDPIMTSHPYPKDWDVGINLPNAPSGGAGTEESQTALIASFMTAADKATITSEWQVILDSNPGAGWQRVADVVPDAKLDNLIIKTDYASACDFNGRTVDASWAGEYRCVFSCANGTITSDTARVDVS